MYRLTDYAAMLRDRVRVEAYRRALAAVITPQSTVLDLGTGVGTFAVMAARLGAKHVYAVDSAEVIATAEQVARASGVADRITFLHARALDVTLPERVDVIVSDLGGALPIFEEHIPSLVHAREHLLKPDGVLIPQRARLMCAPVSSAELDSYLTGIWSVDDIDFTPAYLTAMQMPHALRVQPQELAAAPQCWAELDFATITSPDVRGSATWTLDGDRMIHGVALWFESTLRDGVTYASGPWSQSSVHATMVLPLTPPHTSATLRINIEAKLVDGHYETLWNTNDPARDGGPSIVAAPGQLSAKLGDEAVIAAISRGQYYGLNPVAARVWQLIQTPIQLTELCDTITAEFDVTRERCEADLRALIDDLRKERLIQ